MAIKIDPNNILKAVLRRSIERFDSEEPISKKDLAFDKDANVKVLTSAQLKQLDYVLKNIKSVINLNENDVKSLLGQELVLETYHDLMELYEVLLIRTKILNKTMKNENISEEWKNIFAETYDLDILRGILEILDNFNPEDCSELFKRIFDIRNSYVIDDILLDSVIEYQETKNSCIFPRVVDFLDSNFHRIAVDKDAFLFLGIILREFSADTVKLPFHEDTKFFLEQITIYSDSDFYEKDENSLIKLVNGIFIWINRIPQLGECSFAPLIDVTPKKYIKRNSEIENTHLVRIK